MAGLQINQIMNQLHTSLNPSSTEGVLSGTTATSTNSANTATQAAVNELKQMLVGDIFTGEIDSASKNQVTIRLGSGNMLSASLLLEEGMANLQKGDIVSFLIQAKNDSLLSLKPLDSVGQMGIVANQALSQAGLASTPDQIMMVKIMMDLNLPIDKETLHQVSALRNEYPNANLENLLRLFQLELPVNQNNLMQMEAYRSYEHDMTGTLGRLYEDFQSLLTELSASQQGTLAKELTGNLLQVLSPEVTGGEFMDSLLEKNPDLKQSMNDILNGLMKDLQSDPEDPFLSTDAFQQRAKEMMETLGKASGTVDEKLQLVKQLLQSSDLPVEFQAKLLQSKEFGELFQDKLQQTLFMKPENMHQKEEVQDFYKKLMEVTAQSEALLKQSGLGESNFSKGMASVRQNLEFMNDLNSAMPYMQIPIQLTDGTTRGDLYVYTNKHKKLGKDDELTALLHLDMEHLGPMDIYVKLAQRTHVSTNFCLDSEESLIFLEAHMEELTKRLNAKGYDFHPQVVLQEKAGEEKAKTSASVDFTRDFLDVNHPVLEVKRYLFDTKA
ncbi:MAG: flagellar hook-length control protein FliK [Lachnospiraceae bacterium]|nr:flagellar hook-length control protein FliK [Lachnospiraceae bacterium]